MEVDTNIGFGSENCQSSEKDQKPQFSRAKPIFSDADEPTDPQRRARREDKHARRTSTKK